MDLLVIHYISLPPDVFGGPAIADFFTNRLDPAAHPFFAQIAGMEASAHFLIRRDGALVQFVPCARRAWHAGESSWRGRPRCNDYSIGIEVEGSGNVPFTDAQYGSLAALTRALRARYPIGEIVGHSDIAPGRKQDPGPYFDWPRYRAMIRERDRVARARGRKKPSRATANARRKGRAARRKPPSVRRTRRA